MGFIDRHDLLQRITINLDLEKKHDTCMAVIEMVD